MGSNRNEYSKQPASKVSLNIRNEFNINIDDIYSIWLDYNKMRSEGVSRYNAIKELQRTHPEVAFNYFIAMSLELINSEIINGKS